MDGTQLPVGRDVPPPLTWDLAQDTLKSHSGHWVQRRSPVLRSTRVTPMSLFWGGRGVLRVMEPYLT